MGGINDGVYPETCGSVAWIRLMLVCRANRFVEFFLRLFVHFLAFAFELLQFDFDKRSRCRIATHDGIACRWPGEYETWVVSFAAHRVVTSAKTAAADDGNFRHHTVRHRVDHFCARANDAAPFGVFADHEPI